MVGVAAELGGDEEVRGVGKGSLCCLLLVDSWRSVDRCWYMFFPARFKTLGTKFRFFKTSLTLESFQFFKKPPFGIFSQGP